MEWTDNKFAGFDIETSGTLPEYALQPWRYAQGDAWITCMSFVGTSLPKPILGKITPTRQNLEAMLRYCIEHDITVVGWNVTFDVSWLIAYGLEDLVFKVKWLDGMLLWRHYFIEPEYDTPREKKMSYRLKLCVAENWPERAGYEDDVDFHDTSPESMAKLLKYCKRDTGYALALAKKYYYHLLESDPRRLKAALIEAESIPMIARANVVGMQPDVTYSKALTTDLNAVAAKCLSELAPHGVTEKIVKSPKQLSNLLFNVWGLPVIKQNTSKTSGKVSDSTDKEVLHELSFIDPRAKVLRQYREALNNQTKFPKAIVISVDYNGDGMTHPTARIFGTYTGRMTYDSTQGRNKDKRQIGFALHQMKRGKQFRNEIVVPEGYTLCEFDAAGQEFRWMAEASQDETMLQLCMPGEDPHGYMGARIVSRDYRELVDAVHDGEVEAKDARQLGKVANLSLQYRTSAPKLCSVARVQYNIDMDVPRARGIRSTYLETYRGVPQYWEDQIAICSKRGYAETFAGRRVQLLDDFDGPRAWQLASTTINYRIQGTGADQKYLALAVLKPYMVRHGIHFAWELHDGLYLYIPDHLVAKCVPEIKTMLATLPYTKAWGYTPSIPLPWDAKVGKSWGELKEWEDD